MDKKKGLGRGLEALIFSDVSKEDSQKNKIIEIDINKIEPNLEQPRKKFDKDSLADLAQSIKTYGIIQPIIVKENNNFFEIIAGERRWRAARIAELEKIPCIVRSYDELEGFKVSLIENLQREDLNPIEEAKSYQRLYLEFDMKQEEIANQISKSRSTVTNSMRLLNLDERVQGFLLENKIFAGHGRALLALENKDLQFELSEKIIEEDLSVRACEKMIKTLISRQENGDTKIKEERINTQKYLYIESYLQELLGTKVKLLDKKDKGSISIEYYSVEELDRLIELLKHIDKTP